MIRSLASICAALAFLSSRAASPSQIAPTAPASSGAYTTWIEKRAPGAFDATTPLSLAGLRVAYRMDAQILLPLWITTLEIYSRSGVGFATAYYRDTFLPSGERIRVYEFFTASTPERARGIDRTGFFREAHGLAPGAIGWTAYFGTMTLSPEQTMEQAERAKGRGQTVSYEVIDGFATARETTAGLFNVELDRPGTSAGALYESVRPKLEGRQPRSLRSLDGSGGRVLPPMAFLSALQASLQEAAASRARPRDRRVPRVAFVHNGTVRYLEVRAMSRDAARGRAAATRAFVKDPAAVYRLDFRIVIPGDADSPFRLWAELPPDIGPATDAPPIAPLAFELRPRSFLRLHFERSR